MGLPYAEPASFLALRFYIVCIVLGLVSILMKKKLPLNISDLKDISIIGILVHGVYLGGIFGGINLGVTAGDSALIVGMQPIITAILMGPVIHEKINAKQWIGFIIGSVGVALVSLRYIGHLDSSFLGIILCIIGVLGISTGTLLQKKWCKDIDIISGSFVQFLAAAIMMTVISLLFETREISWTGEFIFALGWLVVVLSLGAISLLWFLIQAHAPTKFASLFFLVPPATAIIAWPLFREVPSTLSIVGMILIIFGVLLVNYVKPPYLDK